MFPSATTYWTMIVPKIRVRAKGCCEECGRKDFLWVTAKKDLEDWEYLEITGVQPLPLEKSNLIAVCYRCAGPFLVIAELYQASKKKYYQRELQFD